jgi:dimethylargininase
VSTRFTRAILRRPGTNFAAGITSGAGRPDLALALAQHAAYARALEAAGLALTVLEADMRYPDGTFVEDTAVVTARGAILARPGASTRRGEIDAMAPVLEGVAGALLRIEAPGTVDGGDICQCEDEFLIGVSARTNEAGAEQLATLLGALGYRSRRVDIRASKTLLHLKTGLSYLGAGRLVVAGDLPDPTPLAGYEPVAVDPQEAYAANCVRVNDRVLVAAGFPRFAERLARLGLDPLPLDMSEFRKMDGGLSCLSIRC